MESDEARKALALALKHDQGGNTEGALKWARKSIAIHTTVEAERLLARLEKSGASGAGAGAGASPFGSGSASASASASASTSGGADGLRNRSSASTNGTAKPPNGVPKPAAAARAAETPKREFTAEQEAVVKKVKRSGGDFYAVLGLEKSCEEAAIKKAYRKVSAGWRVCEWLRQRARERGVRAGGDCWARCWKRELYTAILPLPSLRR